jgi:Domain of unknown function (DUF4198)
MRLLSLAASIVLSCAAGLAAHDLFLRPKGFFLAPGATVVVPVINGTFSRSENAVTRDRLADLSMAGPSGRQPIPRASWTEAEPRSTVQVTVQGPGSYVVGASVAPRALTLEGPAFDAYLKEEGIDTILAARKASGRLGRRARERYAKAVKTIVAVTDERGHVTPAAEASAATSALGYPAEIVPLVDPYSLKVGQTLRVRALVDQAPLAGWVILAGGRIGTSDDRIPVQRFVTDAGGVASVRLTHDGHWYVKFVHMRAATAPDFDYESRWATLTFGLMP